MVTENTNNTFEEFAVKGSEKEVVPEEGIGRTECFLKMEIMKSLYVNWNDLGERENLTMQKGGRVEFLEQ